MSIFSDILVYAINLLAALFCFCLTAKYSQVFYDVIKAKIQKYHQKRTNARRQATTIRQDSSYDSSINNSEFTSIMIEKDQPTCAICLDIVDQDSETTNCNHIYHTDCLDNWDWLNVKSCPFCRNENYRFSRTLVIEKESEADDNSCPICFEDIYENPEITNCYHSFHKRCLDKWDFFNSKSCPCCRKDDYRF